jgi:hypothetical protein
MTQWLQQTSYHAINTCLLAHHKWHAAWNDSHFLRRRCNKQKPMFTLRHLLRFSLLPKTVTEKFCRSLEQRFILSLERSLFIKGTLLQVWYNLSFCSASFCCVIFVYVLSSRLFFWLVITCYFAVSKRRPDSLAEISGTIGCGTKQKI